MAEAKKPIENEFQKARVLYEKGVSEYNKNNFAEALNYFNASYKLNPEDSTQIYIKRCKKSIVNNNAKHESNTGKNSTPNVNHAKTDHHHHHEKERSKSTPVETEQDRECLKIIKKTDYYEILEVSKTADENEIKKAYKKLAIKYHPDKNQSKHTEEAFKKISHAFTTLKDPEKKKLYDLYGSEEEIRERQAQNQAHYNYQQEEVDPFDLFEMFFNGGSFQQNGNFRRRANTNAQRHQQQNQRNDHAEGNVRVNKYAFLFQLLPLVLIFLLSVIPSLFQSKPYYQFSRDEEYYKRMTSAYNSINYYVGDKFINTYSKIDDIRKLEYNVERDYLNFVAQKCNQAMQYKNDLEYKLAYYRHSNYYVKIKQELDNLDLSKCKEYYRLKNVVR